MAEYKQNYAQVRNESAQSKAKFVSRSKAEFRIEENDLLLLTGPYAGSRVRELWDRGPDERDYIFKSIYINRDSEVQRIIKSLFCSF
jgi:hypothetical protein